MSDRNFYSYSDVSDILIAEGTVFAPDDPLEYDDILKFSHARNMVGDRLIVEGGRENCIDMNRQCENIALTNLTLIGGGQAAIVIKGGSQNIELENVVITPSKTAWCDILIGDWSDQSNDRSTDIFLTNITRSDGHPVRVVVGRATRPVISGGNCEILKPESLAVKAYWWAKYVGRKLHLV